MPNADASTGVVRRATVRLREHSKLRSKQRENKTERCKVSVEMYECGINAMLRFLPAVDTSFTVCN